MGQSAGPNADLGQQEALCSEPSEEMWCLRARVGFHLSLSGAEYAIPVWHSLLTADQSKLL